MKLLKRIGEPVTINWPSRAANAASSIPAVSTFAFIESKSVDIAGNGIWANALVAMLPAMSRDLQDATLTTSSGKKYKLTSYSIQNGLKGEQLYQEVILK